MVRDVEGDCVDEESKFGENEFEMLNRQVEDSSTAQKSKRKSTKFQFWIIICMTVVAIVSCLVIYSVMKINLDRVNSNYVELQNQFFSLEGQLADLSLRVDQDSTKDSNRINSTMAAYHKFTSLTDSKISELQGTVLSISNHSNVEVLNQLAQTQSELTTTIQNTQLQIQLEMNETMIKINSVIASATSNIQSIQANVTNELQVMGAELRQTVMELNTDVETAKDSINEEVTTIKDTISTYIVASDKQFAAENDFVRFQLAGTTFASQTTFHSA
jgi:hypothetical protein